MPIPRFAGEQLSFDPPGYLFFGDNLEVLPRHIPDESIDLIYLDPPFNSNKSYNLLFEYKDGRKTAGQMKAFDDSWTWTLQSEVVYEDVVSGGGRPSAMLRGMREIIGPSDMFAYVVMMTPRLIELRRTLKPTGSLYLHCDPTASHYLKLVLDAVFGPENFLSEVIWKRTHSHGGASRYGPVHDVLLFYAKSEEFTWTSPKTEYSEEYVRKFFKFTDPDGRRYRSTILTGSGIRGGESGKAWRGYDPTAAGRHWAIPGYIRPLLGEPAPVGVHEALERLDSIGRMLWPAKKGGVPSFKQYLDDMGGVDLQDVWTDLPPISAKSKERLGYPTQKPVDLLERIIAASSNQGDIVLDPFCGCGTTIEAAQRTGRRWIGIDITKVAIEVISKRLEEKFPNVHYITAGEPATIEEAEVLATLDKLEFQRWALDRIGISNPIKLGRDGGIDGEIVGTHPTGRTWRAIVSVKGGGVTVEHVRALRGTMAREKAEMGVFLTLKPPTPAMKREAAEAGLTKARHPVLQILTIAEMFDGRKLDLPARRPERARIRKLPLRPRASTRPAGIRSA